MSRRRISKNFSDGSKVDIYLDENNKFKQTVVESLKVYATQDIELNEGINKVPISFESKKNGIDKNFQGDFCFEGSCSNRKIEAVL